MTTQPNIPEHPAMHQAQFLLCQFIHYAEATSPAALTEQERALLVLYYTQLQDLLRAARHKGLHSQYHHMN